MKIYIPALLCATFLVPNAVAAFEVTGGELTFGTSAFTDDTSLNRMGIEGAVEFAFNRSFGVQAELGYNKGNFSDLDSVNVGLHFLYHLDDNNSFGAFAVNEASEGEDLQLYGIEFGIEANKIDYEGYYAKVETEYLSTDMFGFAANYEFDNGIGITGSYDNLGSSGINASRLAVKLDRDVSESLNLYVEAGKGKIEALGVGVSEPFVGLGATVTFGAERGATFDIRSIGRKLPGL
ncbi:MAG: hypothetical protein ACSHWZ_04275 [Sulfitobacter sp.]